MIMETENYIGQHQIGNGWKILRIVFTIGEMPMVECETPDGSLVLVKPSIDERLGDHSIPTNAHG